LADAADRRILVAAMTRVRIAVATALVLACTPPTAETKPAAKTKPAATVEVAEGPVTSQTLLAFMPATLGDAAIEMKQVADEALAAASYRTPTGFINVNLSLTRDLDFDRAMVEGARSDEVERNEAAGIAKQGVAVGTYRAVFLDYLSGSKGELRMFLGDRISVNISREGKQAPEALVALAQELDLDGLAALAPRVPAPMPR
jgi:hypothetical protein